MQEVSQNLTIFKHTPAGQRLEACLDILNTCDWDVLEDSITQNFAETVKERFPIFILTAIHRQFYFKSGGLGYTFISTQADQDGAFTLKCINKLTGHAVAVDVNLDPQNAYTIKQPLSMRTLQPTDCGLLPRTLTETQKVDLVERCVSRMAVEDVYSGSLLLAKNGEPLIQGAYGMANRTFMVPNRMNTKYNIASLGKMFTGVATAQLYERGKLGFSDPVSQYLPAGWLDDELASKIQIHHLLTHTSGLGDYFPVLYSRANLNYYRELDDYKPLLQDITLAFEPGTKWSYSNTGMLLLGVVIENICGQSYFDYVREHIFSTAGMGDTGAYEADEVIANRSTGYSKGRINGVVTWRNNSVKPILKGSPSGGSFSTVEDLMRFDGALRAHVLLRPDTTDLVLSPKPDLHSPFYGFGFFTSMDRYGRCASHAGDGRGINCQFRTYLDAGYTFIALSNVDPPGANILSDLWHDMATYDVAVSD